MAKNIEVENVEEFNESEYVTRSELESLLDTKLEGFVSQFLGNNVAEDVEDGWEEITEDVEELVGNLSPAQVERMMEEKVQEALANLGVKKQARQPVPLVD